jgi:hypothetical protein
MQLEAEEPPHRAFASLGNALEGLVLEDALVLAYPQRGAVDEADASALAHQDGLDEHCKFNDCPLLQFNETVVRHRLREQVPHMLADMIQIEVLQASIAGIMEQNQNGHHLGVRHLAIAVIFAFLPGMTFSYREFRDNIVKILTELITHEEYFCNFAIRKHSGCFYYLFLALQNY